MAARVNVYDGIGRYCVEVKLHNNMQLTDCVTLGYL